MSSASSSSAAAGGTGGRGWGATGTNQLAHALETRDDEVASASLLVQAMWKADDHQPIYELKRHGSDQYK